MMRFSLKILCVIIFVCTEARDGKNSSVESGIVGDPCRPTQDVSDGQCVLVTDCDVALRHIREKFTHPFRRCGFVRTLEVVCCPKKPNHGVATTKRAIISTTSQSVATNSPLQTSSSPTVPKKLGDRCVPTQNITEGECRLVSDCAIALRAINEQETHPFKRCGFKGKMEIICCPNPQSHPIDSAKKEATNYKSTNSTSIAEMSKVSITIADNVLKVSTTKADNASKDFTTIADKQCKKIIEKTLPPISLHIVGGSNAEPGEFPHMVALGYNFDGSITFKCGGALISENFVITAAHCTHSPTRDIPTFVRMGVVHIGENVFNPNTDVKIAKIIIHPDFKDGLKYHDIALLRLERPVDYSETVIPVCLHTGVDIPNVPLTITGWGRTSYIIDGVSKMLQKANVTATPQEQCVEDYSKWRKLPAGIARGQFCAGDSAASRDACQGDSGGPLQGLTAGDGYYRLIGITSFGRGCGGLVPGVYTRVSVYREWIESIVWPNEV